MNKRINYETLNEDIKLKEKDYDRIGARDRVLHAIQEQSGVESSDILDKMFEKYSEKRLTLQLLDIDKHPIPDILVTGLFNLIPLLVVTDLGDFYTARFKRGVGLIAEYGDRLEHKIIIKNVRYWALCPLRQLMDEDGEI